MRLLLHFWDIQNLLVNEIFQQDKFKEKKKLPGTLWGVMQHGISQKCQTWHLLRVSSASHVEKGVVVHKEILAPTLWLSLKANSVVCP